MAAEGLGELVDVTSEPVLKPFVVKMTGRQFFRSNLLQCVFFTHAAADGFNAFDVPASCCGGLMLAVQ